MRMSLPETSIVSTFIHQKSSKKKMNHSENFDSDWYKKQRKYSKNPLNSSVSICQVRCKDNS